MYVIREKIRDLINCGEVIEQKKYSDAERESVMNYLDSIKEELLKFIE